MLGLVFAACAAATGDGAGLTRVVYNSTALAGAVLQNGTVASFSTEDMVAGQSAVWTGTVTLPQGAHLFGAKGLGYVRLWVDDHRLVDAAGGGDAAYAVPVPFFPGVGSAGLRVEYTVGVGQGAGEGLEVTVNGSALGGDALLPEMAAAEAQYNAERAEAEVGWNTWLSDDMLTHARLPEGVAMSLGFRDAAQKVALSNLGAAGPSCDRGVFPATHGLHARRGEYTEIASVDFNGGQYRVESATVNGEVWAVVTTLGAPASPSVLNVTVGVPATWVPRQCVVTTDAAQKAVRSACPGFPVRTFHAAGAEGAVSGSGLVIPLAADVGGVAALYSYNEAAGGAMPTAAEVAAAVAEARAALLKTYAASGGHNETHAGVAAGIAWNVIYTPLEGIVTPVFRGAPWPLAQAHRYVLFEWDTYLAAIIAAHVDPWVAKSNVVRLTKSMVTLDGGFVSGFWNGDCGEVDKSKPPLGAMALQSLGSSADGWVTELLFDRLALWNRWWERRFHGDLYAPGSTRENINTPVYCKCIVQDPLAASSCETGLDNSPLYDGAAFVDSANTLNIVDVGMSALVAQDAAILSGIAALLGKADLAAELGARSTRLKTAITSELWDDANGLYFNKPWTGTGAQGFSTTAAPTNFYPMLLGAPTDAQVQRMLTRWLVNATEFAVNASAAPAAGAVPSMPSVARSSPAFGDNNYWRGRSWGPMNWLVYVGLTQYRHLPEVEAAIAALARQSEATFLVEWTAHGRVMENYNSVTGEGCDVGNSIPMYHWGALHGLIALVEAGAL